MKKGYSPIKRMAARGGKSNSHVDIKALYYRKVGFEIKGVKTRGVKLIVEGNGMKAAKIKTYF